MMPLALPTGYLWQNAMPTVQLDKTQGMQMKIQDTGNQMQSTSIHYHIFSHSAYFNLYTSTMYPTNLYYGFTSTT